MPHDAVPIVVALFVDGGEVGGMGRAAMRTRQPMMLIAGRHLPTVKTSLIFLAT
jgi:hypothetical protein